jgi:putative ABC transport system permease protein
VLRAVGQTRAQLRAMVRWESVIVASFGAVGGIGLGVFLGWGLVRALQARTDLATFVLPIGSLLTVLAAGILVGVLAGLRPAWRASRLDPLTAIATP